MIQYYITAEQPTNINDIGEIALREFRIYQNYPNPFNPETVLSYIILKPMYVNLDIYNIVGEKVAILLN